MFRKTLTVIWMLPMVFLWVEKSCPESWNEMRLSLTTPSWTLLRFCLCFLSMLALSVSAAVLLAARPLISLITPDAELTALAVPMLRWQVAGCVFGGIVMLLTCLFQASGKALPAMILSLSRQGVVFIAVLLIAVKTIGYEGILVSQFIADILSAALALGLYISIYRYTGDKAA